MKTIPIQLLQSTTRALFMKATRKDGQVFGFTGVDKSVLINGLLYSIPLNFSQIAQSIGFDSDNGEMGFLPDEEAITSADLITGAWNNFSYEVFEADWQNPSDINIITVGTAGEVSIKDDLMFVAETRGLKQALQNPQGLTTQKTCRNRFADYPTALKPNIRCRLDIADFTVTGTADSSANRYQMLDAARGEAEDWFGLGTLEFTSGANEGRERQVTAFAAGLFTVNRAFESDISPGDNYIARAGCRGRHERTLVNPDGISDCIDKFDNILNFQGEPHTPGVDAVSRGASTI